MTSYVRFVIHCYRFALFWTFLTSAAGSSGANSTENSIAGYGFEVMMAKLDYLQYKLHEIELGQKERDAKYAEKFAYLEGSIEHLQARQDKDVGYNLYSQQIHSRFYTQEEKLTQHTVSANYETVDSTIDPVIQKLNQSFDSHTEPLVTRYGLRSSIKSCKEVYVSAVYWIQVSENSSPFEAYCEQNSHGGGWLKLDGISEWIRVTLS
ncbi:FBN9 protein [Anopheles sinensis]|uniref:FBN9 protein n=1 Tax=Anopheles sinensis TaxID=74873 RepID=A0A084W3M7_ANOSI|nr:FBN9 protein [Anopheles sinensis]